MSREQVDRFFVQFGREHRQTYARSLRQLVADMGAVDPVLLLSNLASYVLFHPEGTDPEMEHDRPVLQFHLEFVQALALTRDRSEFGPDIAVRPELFQRVCASVQEVAESWAHSGFAQVAADQTERDRARLVALARIRQHTAAIRNWGFPDQMARIQSELVAPLDEAVEGETGLRATHLLRMQAAIVSLVEERYNGLMRQMARAFGAGTVPEVLATYGREFPDLAGDEAAVASLLGDRGAGLDQVKLLLLRHRELSFPALYTLSLDDIVGCYPGHVDRRALLGVATAWSMGFGHLKGRDPEHFFLDNPVWARPFVRHEAETFFCPVVGALHSFGLGMLEEFLGAHPGLRQLYEARRARVLEAEAEGLFRRHFPSAAIFPGSKWRNPASGHKGENDLLVVLDEHAVVVEAKSGKVTAKALRGHPERLEKTVGELVVEPSLQGRRFAELLRASPGSHRFATKRGRANMVDSSKIRRYLFVNVTLELFGILGLRWPVLRDAGLVPPDVEPTVTMSLVDLEILLRVLDSQSRRLHYLSRRNELEHRPHFLGDELDLLAYYLQTGFHLGDLEFADNRGVDLGLHSKLVDQVYQAPPEERPSYCPGLLLAPLWRELLRDLEDRRPPGWTTAAVRLLDVPFDDQRRLAASLERVASKARRAPGSRAAREERTANGPRGRRRDLVAAAFKGFRPDEIAAHIKHLTVAAKERGGGEPVIVHRCVDDRSGVRISL